MTCSKGPQVESNPGPLRKDMASVYGAPALLTEPPGAPGEQVLSEIINRIQIAKYFLLV